MKTLDKIMYYAGKLWDFLRNVFTTASEMITSEVQELKDRIATVTVSNTLRYVKGQATHFLATASLLAGLKYIKNPYVQKLKEFVGLPYEDCVKVTKAGFPRIRPIRLGCRLLERMYNTVMYDKAPSYFNFHM